MSQDCHDGRRGAESLTGLLRIRSNTLGCVKSVSRFGTRMKCELKIMCEVNGLRPRVSKTRESCEPESRGLP